MENDITSNTPNPEQPVTAAPAGPEASWLDAVLTLRQDLRFDLRTDANGDAIVFIEDPIRSKFFQIGTNEYDLLQSLDGTKSLTQIIEKQPEKYAPEFATQVGQWLVQSNLAYSETADSTKRLDEMANALGRQKMMGILNPISFKIKLFNPNHLVKKLCPYFEWCFSKSFLAVWILVAFYAGSIVFTQWDQLTAASIGILADTRWIWLLVIWLFLKVIHELAHGIACRRYGGEVPEAGVLMLLFTPMAYVNVTSMWRFSNRWHRIVVSAAGMYIELFISFIAIILWSQLPAGLASDLCFNIVIMASVTTILFNANPLMRFDGYYILSDLLGIPNLYPKGTKWFGDRLRSSFFGLPKTENICPPNEKAKVAIYGSMAFFWKILISISLTIGASVLFQGAGLALAAFGIVLWFGMPIYQQYQSLFGQKATQKIDKRRTLYSCATVAIICLSLFCVFSAPASKSAPAIVQFQDEQILRAGATGFIDKILVNDGDLIRKDQVLVRLRNPQLQHEVLILEQKLEEAKIQARIHRQRQETSLAQMELTKLVGLETQLAEKREEAENLLLRSPLDGFAFQRGLSHRIGSFVEQGDPVINVAHHNQKEIVVSIDQADLESIKGNSGRILRVAFPGVEIVNAPLKHIDQQASDVPSHPSLCANAGGPLPVLPVMSKEPGQEGSVRLLNPRFNVELNVDSEMAAKLASGQRGRAFFLTKKESLASYLYLATKRWFENKIEQATLNSAF